MVRSPPSVRAQQGDGKGQAGRSVPHVPGMDPSQLAVSQEFERYDRVFLSVVMARDFWR
jgi:hypothetical protein